ncbi:MAG: hypothetical protein JXR88_03365 [Clostridia bacterium]|nr:hypothetical protein [Clostridia bacterium]
MFDCHTHILFGVDDGAKSIEESKAIIHELMALGFKHIMLTPHHIKYSVENKLEDLRTKFEQLKEAFHEEEVTLYLGNEIYLDIATKEDLETAKCLPLNKGPYVLIELPFDGQIQHLEDLLFEIKLKGYVIILAHAERYTFVQNNLEMLKKLMDQGILIQMNLASLAGGYGKVVEKTAKQMVKKQYLHFIGSDVHRKDSKLLNIESSIAYLKKHLPKPLFHSIVSDNGNQLLQGEIIEPHTYVRKKKRWLKRVMSSLLIITILVGSGIFYGYKKIEKEFESAMIEQAKIYQENRDKEEAIRKAEEEKKYQEEKLLRENQREEDRLARLELRKIEDARLIAYKAQIEEKIKAEEEAEKAAVEAAKNEAEKQQAIEAARIKREELEQEKKEAEAEAEALEQKRIEEEARIQAEAEAEEVRIEAEKAEKARLEAEEKARLEAEMEAKYTDYDTDKAKAMDLALSKLSIDQVNDLIKMASGGFNPEEKAKAKKMFYNNFTQEEQTWILEMYVKYYGG